MNTNRWVMVALLALAILITPRMYSYWLIDRALDEFNQTTEGISTRLNSESLKRAERDRLLAISRENNIAVKRYANASCILIEANHSCSCIDRRNNQPINYDYATCARRARRYNH